MGRKDAPLSLSKENIMRIRVERKRIRTYAEQKRWIEFNRDKFIDSVIRGAQIIVVGVIIAIIWGNVL